MVMLGNATGASSVFAGTIVFLLIALWSRFPKDIDLFSIHIQNPVIRNSGFGID
jgi:hypothetical protein